MSTWAALVRAVKNGSWAPMALAVLTAAVSFGFLTAEQGSALNAVVSSVATAVAAIVAAVHAARGVKGVKSGRVDW